MQNPAAVLLFPLPDALDERLASQVVAGLPFFAQLALNNVLSRDTGMIHAWQPQRVEAEHALSEHDDILHGVIQHVTDVKGTRHVGRGHRDHKGGTVRRGFRAKIPFRFPPPIPSAFHFLWVIRFRNFDLHRFLLSSSRRTWETMSGTTSQATLSMASFVILRTTRSAMRSISSSETGAAAASCWEGLNS